MSPRRGVGFVVAGALGLALAACGSGRTGREDGGGATSRPDAGPPAPRWAAADRELAIAAGAAVITKHQCTRCHELDGLPGAGRPYDCVACHVFLKSLTPADPRYRKIAANNGQDVLDRYIRNIDHLRQVPNLTAVGRRLRPAWIAEFLLHPTDLRPALDDAMLRNPLTPAEARTLARYFAAVADEPADGDPGSALPPAATIDPDRAARGRAVFEQRGCPTCHVVGNDRFDGQTAATLAQSPLAPNLRFARERLGPEALVAWIIDPVAVWPAATMPKLGVSREDAELIRDYLSAPVDLPLAPAAAPLLAMPPAAGHRVSWEEVKERVLGKVCVHCHMNDHEKDFGPGNLGGLGYAGRGLAMRTYEMLVRGARDTDGTRYSVLQRRPGAAWPRILEVMVRRRVENLRDRVPPLADHVRPAYPDGPLGMPMGLPTMTDEELGILRRWIEDGCPGPIAVTGKPGFTDGFLVPDGPITPNRGCQQRDPASTPPRWSTRPAEPPPPRTPIGRRPPASKP